MSTIEEKIICDRCGEDVYKRSIKAENLYKYDTSSKKNYIKSLMKYEGVGEEVATSWANHGLYEQCKKRSGIALFVECN